MYLSVSPYLHGKCIRYPPPQPLVRTRFDSNYGEKEGSTDIYPEKDGTYRLITGQGEGSLTVKVGYS